MQIGVIGAGKCSEETLKTAEEVGKLIAQGGAVLVCGGRGGVMAAAAKGAKAAGGTTVGILPGGSASDANPFIDISIVTDMGHARNVIIVRSSNALIAIEGGYGTLSEIAIARKIGIPVIGLNSWNLGTDIVVAEKPSHAVKEAFRAAQKQNSG